MQGLTGLSDPGMGRRLAIAGELPRKQFTMALSLKKHPTSWLTSPPAIGFPGLLRWVESPRASSRITSKMER